MSYNSIRLACQSRNINRLRVEVGKYLRIKGVERPPEKLMHLCLEYGFSEGILLASEYDSHDYTYELMELVRNDDLVLTRAFVSKGVKLYNFSTPLIFYARTEEMINLLISFGADINSHDTGRRSTILAYQLDRLETMDTLTNFIRILNEHDYNWSIDGSSLALVVNQRLIFSHYSLTLKNDELERSSFQCY